MYTVCPKCALTLVVTAADLRVAQGYVRCGRCSSVFNALARLSDERQATELAEEADTASAVEQSAAVEPPAAASTQPSAEEAIPEDALEFNPATTDVAALFVEPPPNPQWTAATGSFKARIAANQEPAREQPADPQIDPQLGSQVDVEIDAAFLASMLRIDPPDPSSESARPVPAAEPAPQPPRAPARPRPEEAAAAVSVKAAAPALRSKPALRHTGPQLRTSFEAAARAPPAAMRSRTAPEPPREARAPRVAEELSLESDELAAAPPPPVPEDVGVVPRILVRLRAHAWPVGAAAAAVVLLAQILNHYRDELAASPSFNRPLTALYSALGVQLVPHWDLRAYDVRQLGASVDPSAGGLITVRASIKNAARQAQPLPLLRVTLQDRFGNRIAARDVAPRFYLPHTMPASSFLAGGQRIDAEMGFIDPGADAVGFEIDACLPASGGGVACANDAAGAR